MISLKIPRLVDYHERHTSGDDRSAFGPGVHIADETREETSSTSDSSLTVRTDSSTSVEETVDFVGIAAFV
jgi:hypothetical protein